MNESATLCVSMRVQHTSTVIARVITDMLDVITEENRFGSVWDAVPYVHDEFDDPTSSWLSLESKTAVLRKAKQ